MKKTSSLIEDKRKDKEQRAYTHWNPKRHIPLVSLLLWCKMVAVRCFVWPLSLVTVVRLAKIQALTIFKILYLATCKCFAIPYSGLFSKQKFSYKKQNMNFERF